ncbi:hypothetical protein BH09ACT10_BH09ACT10_20410 [soil metagenome]
MIEQVFDHKEMVVTPAALRIQELQERVQRMQGTPATHPLDTHTAFAGLLAMRTGSTYGVDSASLAMALMAGPSQAGAWSAVVGSRDFGIEAAAAAGVDLSRTILVPDPGDQWVEVTAALLDVLTVVVVKPAKQVSEGTAARLRARLRQRGATLIAWGEWPRCEARLSVVESSWMGVGRGHGHLAARRCTVAVQRGTAPARMREMWLPDESMRIRAIEPAVAAAPVTALRVG